MLGVVVEHNKKGNKSSSNERNVETDSRNMAKQNTNFP